MLFGALQAAAVSHWSSQTNASGFPDALSFLHAGGSTTMTSTAPFRRSSLPSMASQRCEWQRTPHAPYDRCAWPLLSCARQRSAGRLSAMESVPHSSGERPGRDSDTRRIAVPLFVSDWDGHRTLNKAHSSYCCKACAPLTGSNHQCLWATSVSSTWLVGVNLRPFCFCSAQVSRQ